MSTDPMVTQAAEVELRAQRLEVSTSRVPVETVVLRRRLVSEVRQIEVTIRREVLEIERTALPAGRDGGAGEGGSGEPLIIVLSEEVPVVHLRPQPYERVTVAITTVQGEQRLTETVAREQAEIIT